VITEKPFKGINYQLRSVTPEDSIEILQLRLDSALNQFIHETSPASHKVWLDEQITKPGDYYFAIEGIDNGAIQGFVGIYDINDDRGEWGRWILSPGSPAAVESYWLILKFGFGLGLNTIYSRTDTANIKVNSIHDSFEFSEVAVVAGDSRHLEYKVHTLNRTEWPDFEANLMKYVRRRMS
jgi:RimJ/RimL family protein N-acetyltransferase